MLRSGLDSEPRGDWFGLAAWVKVNAKQAVRARTSMSCWWRCSACGSMPSTESSHACHDLKSSAWAWAMNSSWAGDGAACKRHRTCMHARRTHLGDGRGGWRRPHRLGRRCRSCGRTRAAQQTIPSIGLVLDVRRTGVTCMAASTSVSADDGGGAGFVTFFLAMGLMKLASPSGSCQAVGALSRDTTSESSAILSVDVPLRTSSSTLRSDQRRFPRCQYHMMACWLAVACCMAASTRAWSMRRSRCTRPSLWRRQPPQLHLDSPQAEAEAAGQSDDGEKQQADAPYTNGV